MKKKPMNQQSKEIHDELEAFAEKYKFKKGIFLIEQEDENKDPIYRVITFQPDSVKPQKLSIHDFAHFYLHCMINSKTFRNIVNHNTEHIMEDAIGLSELTKHKGKPVD